VKLQIWSYNYDPEPTGIGPVSAMLARQLQMRGLEVEVVAAHPHYPEARWGNRLRPYRERRDGISVIRLPLSIGRRTPSARFRQEASFASSLFASLAFIGGSPQGRPDAMLVVSPSFPALLPAILNSRARRLPWVLWLQDLLPDGAAGTGLLGAGAVLRASRGLERTAYREAARIIVVSAQFQRRLLAKGVPAAKVELIYNPATRGIPDEVPPRESGDRPRVLCMGNIGLSQGLAQLIRAFEASDEMRRRDVRLMVMGAGVASDEARAEIGSDRVVMTGLVEERRVEQELRSSTLALVSQAPTSTEFNLPSKLMNYMAYGLPVIAAVNPVGEVARLVTEAEAGWVVDNSSPDSMPRVIAQALDNPAEMQRRGEAGHRFARERFSPQVFGDSFETMLRELV
jgi:colanic acid biosynthesis glycosyl transferase WcaI